MIRIGDDIMNKEEIIQNINNMFTNKEYIFDAYVLTKGEALLKKLILDEGNPTIDSGNFKKSIQNSIEELIIDKFTNENVDYSSAENIADNQKKFYIINQDSSYQPFSVVKETFEPIDRFKTQDIDKALGILFKYKRGDLCMWAYQHIYPTSIPSPKNKFWSIQKHNDIFIEMKEVIFPILKKVDILIIGDKIITSNILLMERSFKFQGFIKSKAEQSIQKIETLNLVSNIDKLTEYIGRSKLIYSKRMMRISSSKVLDKTSQELINSVESLPRWKGKFNIQDNKIVLSTYKEVESLIDLLDETYTRSDVTGHEYKTDVKKLAEPVA